LALVFTGLRIARFKAGRRANGACHDLALAERPDPILFLDRFS
jgi:hypothetical protein